MLVIILSYFVSTFLSLFCANTTLLHMKMVGDLFEVRLSHSTFVSPPPHITMPLDEHENFTGPLALLLSK